MSRKTNKSLRKRVKISKNGKVMVGKPGKNHFNARKSGTSLQKKGKLRKLHMKRKAIVGLLPHATIRK